ncbi:hypothetical protein KC332_g8143 [Hortaea werneckii]|nr:hypothetical protein KC350_g15748 [Hortaea werneckii]KAI6814770.1 hypothetical protein KC358_g11081 [Hortaea werneckii]KAI6940008.1 hypothetical protein KC341_g3807 [Hortaea werneckii]KAI6949154.1 hypothetical protein KC348_g1511 [Hortaea werneckii]KAI6974673.1 hypothetical protein KC321_g4979 [Hortaea werneckii]
MPEVRPRAWTSRSLVNYLNARIDDPPGSEMSPSLRQVLKHPGFLEGINAFDRMVALRYAYLGLSACQRLYFQSRADRGYLNPPQQRWKYEVQYAIKLGDLLFKPAPQMTAYEFNRLLKDIVKETRRLVAWTELQLWHMQQRAEFEAEYDTKLPPNRPSNALELF